MTAPLEIIQANKYEGDTKLPDVEVQPFMPIHNKKHAFLVDDICNESDTLDAVMWEIRSTVAKAESNTTDIGYTGKIDPITLFATSPGQSWLSHHHGQWFEEAKPEDWIVLPYEVEIHQNTSAQ